MLMNNPGQLEYNLPPQNLEAEESVLAGMLLSADVVAEAVDILTPDDFYRPANQKIFKACVNLHLNSKPIDLITVVEQLRADGELDHCGGPVHIAKLTETPVTTNLTQHAKIIKEKALLRKIITKSHEAITACYDPGTSAETVLDQTQSSIMQIDFDTKDTAQTLQEMLPGAVDHYEAISTNRGLTGLTSGYTDIDSILCGFQAPDLIILAARPSMGKTALGCCFGLNLIRRGVPVGFVSLEMSKQQIINRLLAVESKVNSMKFRSGYFSKDDWVKIAEAASRIDSMAPMVIDDTPSLTDMDIRRKARQMVKQHGIKLLIIDYIQLTGGYENLSQNIKIDNTTRNIKALGKELDIPIILLSQLNRKVEERSDKHPVMSDIRDSGAVEQHADIIMFIYRDEVYNENNINNKGKAEIIIAKQRNGPTGTVMLQWHDTTTAFQNYAREEYY